MCHKRIVVVALARRIVVVALLEVALVYPSTADQTDLEELMTMVGIHEEAGAQAL